MITAPPPPELTPAERLELAFDLAEAGLDMMRESLKRRYPGEDEASLQARFAEWLSTPGKWDGAHLRRRVP